MGRFHEALPNIKSAYVTLQKVYTDISAVSVTLCNSGQHLVIAPLECRFHFDQWSPTCLPPSPLNAPSSSHWKFLLKTQTAPPLHQYLPLPAFAGWFQLLGTPSENCFVWHVTPQCTWQHDLYYQRCWSIKRVWSITSMLTSSALIFTGL